MIVVSGREFCSKIFSLMGGMAELKETVLFNLIKIVCGPMWLGVLLMDLLLRNPEKALLCNES